MARIRTIKPEFWSSTSLARVDYFTRLLFIALWSFADDEGRGRALPKELNGFAFPLEEDVTDKKVKNALLSLAEIGCIVLYEAEGSSYFSITSWKQHQVINRPTASRIPVPNECSLSAHGILTEASSPRARAQEVEMEVGNGSRNTEPRVARESRVLKTSEESQEEDDTFAVETATIKARQAGYENEEIELAIKEIKHKGNPVGNWANYLIAVLKANRIAITNGKAPPGSVSKSEADRLRRDALYQGNR